MPKKPSDSAVPPPPRRRRGIISDIPEPRQVTDNLAQPNSGIQDLNFKVTPELHKAFKTTASLRGMAMKDLLDASFRCWIEKFGSDFERELLPPSKDK